MNGLQLQFFVFTFLVFSQIHGKKICDLTNDECVTKGASNYYHTILSKFKESPDPLYYEKIEQKLAEYRYKLINVTVTGIRNCKVKKLTIRPKEVNFDYYLRCPQLVLTAGFETHGTMDSIAIDGEGETKITAEDYALVWKGDYDKMIAEEDQKLRVVIKDFIVEVEPTGKIVFEITNLLSGDKSKLDQANSYMNQNWQEIEKMSRKPIVDTLFRKFFANFGDALNTLPLENILPGEED